MLLLKILMLCGFVETYFDKRIHNKYKTQSPRKFIKYFNKLNQSYTITHYEHLKGKKFVKLSKKDLLRRQRLDMKLYVKEAFVDLPETFDARENWPQCESIGRIYDEEDCVPNPFGIFGTIMDVTCIVNNRSVDLSILDFNCCDLKPLRECRVRDAMDVYQCWLESGLVIQRCKPFEIDNDFTPKPIPPDMHKLKYGHCDKVCEPYWTWGNILYPTAMKDYETEKNYGQKIEYLPDIFMYDLDTVTNNIKATLFLDGPIETLMAVREDFIQYRGGIYEWKYGKYKGEISVKVIGYGVEKGTEYWLAANSWGKEWGEEGLFRVKRFLRYNLFESAMLLASPTGKNETNFTISLGNGTNATG